MICSYVTSSTRCHAVQDLSVDYGCKCGCWISNDTAKHRPRNVIIYSLVTMAQICNPMTREASAVDGVAVVRLTKERESISQNLPIFFQLRVNVRWKGTWTHLSPNLETLPRPPCKISPHTSHILMHRGSLRTNIALSREQLPGEMDCYSVSGFSSMIITRTNWEPLSIYCTPECFSSRNYNLRCKLPIP